MPSKKCFARTFAHLFVLAATFVVSDALSAAADYRVLHAFGQGKDGGGVFAGLARDTKGNLYGTTWSGGAYGYGTVFELTPGSRGRWTETILHNFCKDFPHCTDGALPSTTPVLDPSGNLFGTSNSATFEMSQRSSGWTFNVICDCITPSAVDADGNLYGIGGGRQLAGGVDELLAGSDGWRERRLYSFCSQPGCRDGDFPEWGLSWDASGNLYGTTEFGGNSDNQSCPTSGGCGVAYKLARGTDGHWTHQVLHRFGAFSNDGQLPYEENLTVDSKGNVYGTTLYGGIGGTVFELSPRQDGSWKETILYNFANFQTNGGAPVGGVTFDNLGNLYGTASAGGDPTCSCGVVFKMTPQADGKWTYTVLHRFKGTDGYGPGYNLIFDSGYKHLYGTTAAGGSGGYGVVYEITP